MLRVHVGRADEKDVADIARGAEGGFLEGGRNEEDIARVLRIAFHVGKELRRLAVRDGRGFDEKDIAGENAPMWEATAGDAIMARRILTSYYF